jgi:hypothetical protein
VVAKARQGVVAVSGRRAALGETLSEPLRGLLGLVAAYLISGEGNPRQGYYKGMAPIMGRTNFAAMFARLNDQERARLGAGDGTLFVELALESANLAPNTAGKPVLESVVGTRPGDRVSFSEVTREEWLSGITKGNDLLSQRGYAARFPGQAEKGAQFESMGSLDARTDTAPGGRPAPIVELRRMRQQLRRADWEPVLLGVFDLITDIVTNSANPTYRRAAAPSSATASTSGRP